MALISPPLTLIPKLLVLIALASAVSACKGGGSDPDGDGGEASTGNDSPNGAISCDDDEECDDELFCNGKERCEGGYCRRGTRVDCDDDIACTADSCNEESKSCVSVAPDEDQDGFKDANCLDKDGSSLGDDCDDNDALRFPGNPEVCDPEYRDEDCDPTTIGNRDADNDGYNDAQCCNLQDDGELLCGQDCDDHKANVNPESPEVCDFLDNNCNGKTDEGVAIDTYPDTDHDGHGDDSADPVPNCPGAVGYALINDDCDDSDPEVFKGQFEICDGKDNNCDPERLIDEVQEQAPWFLDVDGDTYGDPTSTPIFSCYRPKGRVLSQNDCNDNNNKINPNATEICDGLDNDCNGWADARAKGVNNFEDDDGDGVADADCGGEDCDDTDPRTAGGAEEVCDHIDNDCDGEVDEQTVQNIWYLDEDGDGWGVVIGSALASCNPLAGRASRFGDCDDTNNAIHPEVTEYCDGLDNDCDGVVDEGASVYCRLDNALSTCTQGACRVFSCTAGFVDADGDAENGCETPINPADLMTGILCNSNSECSNSNLCDGTESCFNGECRLGTPINCEGGGAVLQGDVTITGGTDLKALAGVEMITGTLYIMYTQLSSLIGLESLKSIGGSLMIVGNTKLKKLSGSALSNLELVGGNILVQDNDALTSVNLPSLVYAGGIDITQNDALLSITDYGNLQEVEQAINITNNAALESINAFNNLTTIGGGYLLYWGDGDNACRGNGGILIDNNFALTDFFAFNALERTAGDLCVLDLNSSGDDYYYYYYGNDSRAQAANISTSIVFPQLREVGGGLVVDQSTSVNEVSVPQLRSATFLEFASPAAQDEYGLVTVSAPKLTSCEFFALNSSGCNLDTLDLRALKTAKYVQLNFQCKEEEATVPVVRLDALTSTDYLSVGIGYYPDYLAGAQRDIDLRVPKLSSVYDLYMDVNSDLVSDITFPELKTVGFNMGLYLQARGLEEITFPKLVSVGSSINVNGPTESTELERIDFPALTTVGNGVYILAELPVVSAQSGLAMPLLSVVGTYDNDGNNLPDNNGSLFICTGFYNQNMQSYNNAACTLASSMPNRGFSGQIDTCNQCPVP